MRVPGEYIACTFSQHYLIEHHTISLSGPHELILFCFVDAQGEGLPSVTSVAFSADGGKLYASSGGKEVIEWDLETGAVARRLK